MHNEKFELPRRIFLWHLDQIADMLSVEVEKLEKTNLHFHGRSTGTCPAEKILARNINGPGERPEWRVSEFELTRWMTHMGFRITIRQDRQR